MGIYTNFNYGNYGGYDYARSAGAATVLMRPATAVSGADGAKPVVNGADQGVLVGRKSSPAECQTCANRKYVDGSDEGNVSFKTPGHISPEASASAVMSHEKEHVANAYAKEADGSAKVISASVSLQMAICPECGRAYTAGGTTSTTIAYKNESNPYQQNRKALDLLMAKGANVDVAA